MCGRDVQVRRPAASSLSLIAARPPHIVINNLQELTERLPRIRPICPTLPLLDQPFIAAGSPVEAVLAVLPPPCVGPSPSPLSSRTPAASPVSRPSSSLDTDRVCASSMKGSLLRSDRTLCALHSVHEVPIQWSIAFEVSVQGGGEERICAVSRPPVRDPSVVKHAGR